MIRLGVALWGIVRHNNPVSLTYLSSSQGDLMDKMQELRGEVRQLLNDTLVFAAANRNDFEVADYAAGKAAIYREVLELIAKVDD